MQRLHLCASNVWAHECMYFVCNQFVERERDSGAEGRMLFRVIKMYLHQSWYRHSKRRIRQSKRTESRSEVNSNKRNIYLFVILWFLDLVVTLAAPGTTIHLWPQIYNLFLNTHLNFLSSARILFFFTQRTQWGCEDLVRSTRKFFAFYSGALVSHAHIYELYIFIGFINPSFPQFHSYPVKRCTKFYECCAA